MRRGAAANPPNRFEPLHLEPDPDLPFEDRPAPATRFFVDHSATILNYNDSPDVGFAASINPYRGCEHGCIYCYARPTHEYLGFSAGLDFESRIMVKTRAPELLERELASPKWTPQVLAMSGVTDCYQPAERKLLLTRRCLEVLHAFGNPVGVVTKNHLVTRDADLLAALAAHGAAAVFVSVTTLDSELARRLEPRAPSPTHRLDAISRLTAAGIPTGVMAAPVIPGLTDHELPAILDAARAAGAQFAGYVLLRLPHGLPALFEDWLQRHYPDAKAKILAAVRATRDGQINQGEFGTRMRGSGPAAERLAQWFKVARRRAGFPAARPELSSAGFRNPTAPQLSLPFA